MRIILTTIFMALASPLVAESTFPLVELKPYTNNSKYDSNELLKIIYDHNLSFCQALTAEKSNNDDVSTVQFSMKLDDNLYQLQLKADDTVALVLHAAFSCDGFYPFCGSGGCTNYVIANGRIFETFGHRLRSITQNKMTYIMVPHSGGSCELSDGSEVFGSDSCYGVATWDDYHSAFRSIDNQIQLSELSPQ